MRRNIRIKSYERDNGIRVKAHIRSIQRTVRPIHSSRRYNQRKADEDRKEELTTSITKWLANPNKYDIQNIDTLLPKEYDWDIHDKYNSRGKFTKTVINIRLFNSDDPDKKGKLVANITVIDAGKDGYLLTDVYVKRKYRNKGLSPYLIRQACNEADDDGKKLFLNIDPFEDRSKDFKKEYPKGKKSLKWKRRQLAVADYYRSFGFNYERFPTKKRMRMIRYPVN